MTKFLSETLIVILTVYFALLTIFIFTLVGCGLLRDIGRTANDAAIILCEVFAEERTEKELDGLSPQDWCAIHKNLDPFIREVLIAKQNAGDTLGFKRKE